MFAVLIGVDETLLCRNDHRFAASCLDSFIRAGEFDFLESICSENCHFPTLGALI